MSRFLSPEWRDKLLAAGFPPAELCTGDAEEVLQRLPHTILLSHRRHADFAITKNSLGFTVRYFAPIAPLDETDRKEDPRAEMAGAFGFDKDETAPSLADAAAAMYVWLAEQNLLPAAS